MNFKSLGKKLISTFVVLAMMLPLGISAAFAAEVTGITVEPSSYSVTLGESVDVTVEVDGADAETSTVIKANGITIEEIIGDYYTFTYTPTSEGYCVITANGGGQIGETEIYVGANEAPEVDLGAYADGETIRSQLLDGEVLTATATDDGTVSKMEVIVDGAVVKTAEDDEITIAFGEIGLGTFEIGVVAYDNYGLAGSAGITAKIINEQASSPTYVGETKEDFGAFRDGSTQADKRFAGFVAMETLEDGNTVLAMGKDDRCDPNQTNNDYSMVDVSVSTYINQGGIFSLEFDINYAVPKGKSGSPVTFAMREALQPSGANIQNVFDVRTNEVNEHFIRPLKKNSGDRDYKIEAGKWYHVRMAFDWQNDMIDVYVTPEGGTEVQLTDDARTDLKGNGGKPNLLRLMTELGNNKPENHATVYFDNFVCSTVHTPPNILSIREKAEEVEGEEGTEGEEEEVVSEEIPYTATALTAKVNTVPVRNSVTTDTVYILDSLGNKIVPKAVELDVANYAVNIELAKALDADATYSLVFDKAMKMTSTLEFGADVRKSFKVAKAGCFAEEDDTNWYYVGDDAICVTNVVNGTDEAETVYVLRSVWYVNDQGQNVAKTVVDEVVLETGDNSLSYTLEGAKTGEADMYIITDLMNPMVYANISK